MLRLLILTLVSAVGWWSQAAGTATVVGRITDSSGSTIPGAKVTVVNVDTAFASETITTADGTYNVPYLARSRSSILVTR